MPAQTMRVDAPNIFSVSGRNDVLLSYHRLTSRVQGARVGIEMKTNMESNDFIQAQVECLLLAVNSNYPIIQVWYFYSITGNVMCD